MLVVPLGLLGGHDHGDRAVGEERDPHRRVRAATAAAGARTGRSGAGGGAAAPAADRDDLAGVRAGRGAADAGAGCVEGNPAGDRNRRVRRHGQCDRAGGVLRAGLLCSGAGRAAMDRATPAQAPADAGRIRGWNGTSLKTCMNWS
ncbi:hypothetical protein G6F32_014938 [Rhizopus arrhizus]|nr:hypothetical protein G6F32_014938 [Rhizopus arrhizus]